MKSLREIKGWTVKMGITADQHGYQWHSKMVTRPSPKALMQIHQTGKTVTGNPWLTLKGRQENSKEQLLYSVHDKILDGLYISPFKS